MAATFLPYSVHHYNSLPGLEEAETRFKSAESEILFDKIGQVFIKHHVENRFGAVLLHNHFFLKDNEILVNVGNATVPWDITSEAKELEEVGPCSWRFVDDGLTPYEFVHSKGTWTLLEDIPLAFLQDFHKTIKENNLVDVLGLCLVPENDTILTEFTSGRANITLPFDIAPGDGSLVDAMWRFREAPNDSPLHTEPKLKGKCSLRGPLWHTYSHGYRQCA